MNVKPFIKWAGGKRSVLPELILRLPIDFNRYFEPFVGGGALFFAISEKASYSFISDLNLNLMITYKVIKDFPYKLIELLNIHKEKHSREYYNEIRKNLENPDPIIRSSNFIYLLKTCYNGLHRTNKKGEFNTPIGNYQNPKIVDEENIILVSERLKNTDIKCQDFERIEPKRGDFVYFDPPYSQINDNSFVQYERNGFDNKEQERLRNFAEKLDRQKVKFLVSNADTEHINYIWKNFNIEHILAPRMIGSNPDSRKRVKELIIRNYD